VSSAAKRGRTRRQRELEQTLERIEHSVELGLSDQARLLRQLEHRDRIIDRLVGEVDDLAAQLSEAGAVVVPEDGDGAAAANGSAEAGAAVRRAEALRRRAESDYAQLERAFAGLCCTLNDSAKDFPTVRHTLNNLAYSYRFADHADRRTRSERFDVVQAHDNFGLWPAARLAARDGAGLIVDLVEVTTLSERVGVAITSLPAATRKYIEEIDHRIIRRASAAFTVSASLREFLEERHKREVLLLRNTRAFADPPIPTDLHELCGIPADTKIVCYANRIGVDMGILELIDALRLMRHDAALVCIGKFTDEQTEVAVRRYVTSEGLSERVTFFEQLGAERYERFLAGADVGANAVKPLNRNLLVSLPNRVFDYIAARIPMVTSDVGDSARLVRRYRIGEVFAAVEPEQIAAALDRVLARKPGAYDARLASAAKDLDWEQESDQYLRHAVMLARRARRGTRHAAIVARKPIRYNHRILQQSALLAEHGFEVIVFSLTGFAPEVAERLPPGVREIVITPETAPAGAVPVAGT
jgi:glycosyltransferase involved in cell wall biosynthesis